MNEYDYNGYTITEVDGYYYIDEYSFYSLDEAMDWIDSLEEDVVPRLNTYHIYYVTTDYNCGYDEFIKAYSEDEAIKKLYRMHKDIAYIADCYVVR